MARTLYTFALLFLILTTSVAAQLAGEGTSFILTLPHSAQGLQYAVPKARLLLNSLSGANVNIRHTATGASQTVTLAAGEGREVMIDSAVVILPPDEGIFRNSIQITSSSPVTASLVIDRPFATEGYAAIPDPLLDSAYIVISTEESVQQSVIAVIGVENNTTVRIVPTRSTASGHAQGVPFTVTLNRGEVYQMLNERFGIPDFSGTTLSSNKTFGVLTGSVCADFPIGEIHSCNPLIEQMPGVRAGGTEFVVAPLARQQRGFYRVIALCAPTAIRLNGVEVIELQTGETYEFASVLLTRISTDNAVAVMQLITSTARGLQDRLQPYGDPAWMTVSPIKQWGSSAQVFFPVLDPRNDGNGFVDWRYYMQLMLPVSSEPGLRINGVTPVWNIRQADDQFVVGTVEITPGEPHRVTADGPVATLAYAYTLADAIGFNTMPVQSLLPAPMGEYVWNTCNDTLDTVIMVHNRASLEQEFIGFTALEGINVGVIEMGGATGVTVPARDSAALRIRITGLRSGDREGYLGLLSRSCPSLAGVVKLRVLDNRPVLIPAAGDVLDFGMMGQGTPFVERTVTIRNPGPVPMEIQTPAITPARYIVTGPTFPLLLAPGESVTVTIRFLAGEEGLVEGSIGFIMTGCPEPLVLTLRALQNSGVFVSLPPPAPVRLLCGPKVAQIMPFQIENRGSGSEIIRSAVIVGAAAAEFELLTPLDGIQIDPGERFDVRVRYTPGPLGQRQAGLRVVSGPAFQDTLQIPFDVRNDSLLLEPIDDMLDFGITDICRPSPVLVLRYVNLGTVPVTNIRGRLTVQSLVIESLTADSAGVGDTVQLALSIDPSIGGQFNGGVNLRLDPCAEEFFVPARGERTGATVSYSSDTLDFGVLPHCSEGQEIVLTLGNNGGLPDTLDLLRRPALPEFSLVVPPEPIVVEPGNTVQVIVRFDPSNPGFFRDSIVFRSRACLVTRTIVVRGSFDNGRLEASTPLVNFGPVDAGSSLRRVVTITNRSAVPRTLSPATLEGNVEGVRVLRPQGDTTLQPGESVEVELEYAPLVAGSLMEGLAVLAESFPCDDTLRITLRGFAPVEEVDNRLVSLRWEEVSGEIGRETGAKLFIEQQDASGPGDSLLLRVQVRFNASMLLPVGVDPLGNGLTARIVEKEVVGNDLLVTLEASGIFPVSGTLLELRILPALGNAEVTPLAFEDVSLQWEDSGDSVALLDTTDGSFRALGICREGGVRLFTSTGFLRLAPPSPNPVRDETIMEFEVAEHGPTTLTLYDARGDVVAVPFNTTAIPGTHVVSFDASSLPDGPYWLILQTPTTALRQGMVVAR